MIIDLRSDTVTHPTPAMREAMFTAPLGDDVLGDDPTVNALEAKAASLFGMEAALFCASGTLTNQLAIRTHTRPGDDVICDYLSHVYQYEGGGISVNALASTSLAHGERGKLTPDLIREYIYNPTDSHKPLSRLVVLENTVNKGGGCYYTVPEVAAIRQVCNENGLILHLDGARLFNALVETGEPTTAYGQLFDSISICLSKGLGCPVGSLLLGKSDFIRQARRFRKLMGGGWRQAGFLAAAGIYALDHHVDRLKLDHARARKIGAILERLPEVVEILPIDTNIVIFRLPETILATDYVQQLETKGIRAITFGKHLVRFVTHLDFTDEMVAEMENILTARAAPPGFS
ncbi:aminotransferase class I/II-fold pyridoxal phosphate-dependent enzyme [Spirosoma sp. HMF4905]|uniref:Aminotransferase class I/II-fold pyridoxal phosphate-dependent enzyme n=1 Tax=Spirosoma arboris TaxID=2682092 RepID=A0A7K1S9Q6_9BACT|nr:GntG family PLP-dependent aldolase [Spirosoma arboris]MVM30547.1 aminotransferase class I/II-fold pyridoxal phosphate-dependent enzyme [Spirosoma arboris]